MSAGKARPRSDVRMYVPIVRTIVRPTPSVPRRVGARAIGCAAVGYEIAASKRGPHVRDRVLPAWLRAVAVSQWPLEVDADVGR
jgi:hypothetical protein